ncbi:MAG: hypothetical protein ACI39F_09035 [Acutalibacteraceae bacterium]
MVFNFNDLKRETFDMIFPGEKEVSLHLLRPLKGQVNTLISATQEFDDIVKNQKATPEQMKLLTSVTAEMLSRNTENKKFTADEVLNKFDVDELIYFIDSYLSFVLSFTNLKN